MQLDQYLFWIFAIAACAGAISVVVSQNVVRMAVSLIASLSSVSALFFLMGAEFIGVVQLMVYVGGTVVLLIFGVMLTGSSPLTNLKTSPADVFMSGGVGLLFLLIIGTTLGAANWVAQPALPALSQNEAETHSQATLTLDPIPDYKMARFLTVPLTGIGAKTSINETSPNELTKSFVPKLRLEATADTLAPSSLRIDYSDSSDTATLYVTNKSALASDSHVSVSVRSAGIDNVFDTQDDQKFSQHFRVTTHASDTRQIALSLLGVSKDDGSTPTYLFPFEIVSMHLLVVLIGAAYLARPKHSKPEKN